MNRSRIAKDFYPGLFHPYYFIRRRLYNKIAEHASFLKGDLLDFGCGAKPYKHLFDHCHSYIGVDFEGAGHNHAQEQIDVFYDGKSLPFETERFDSIFCSEVFEHLFNLDEILKELNRVIKTGGNILITCPFAWPEHEKPYDFARYTRFALESLLERNGFKLVKVDKSGNFFLAVHQLRVLYVYQYVCAKFSIRNKTPFLSKAARSIFVPIMNIWGLLADAILPSNKDFYLNNVILAQKISK